MAWTTSLWLSTVVVVSSFRLPDPLPQLTRVWSSVRTPLRMPPEEKEAEETPVLMMPTDEKKIDKILLNEMAVKSFYSYFNRPVQTFLKRFEERQLYVSTRRCVATVRDLELDLDATNVLFNPFAEDPYHFKLTDSTCEKVSIKWKSLFSLNKVPLDIRFPSVELTFDGSSPVVPEATKDRIKNNWIYATGEPKPPTAYPPVEGANFYIDRLVCVFNRVETPLPGYKNATVKVGLRGLRAVSVDKDGEQSNLRDSWTSFNGPFRKANDFIIAKRIVAADLQITVSKTPGADQTASQRWTPWQQQQQPEEPKVTPSRPDDDDDDVLVLLNTTDISFDLDTNTSTVVLNSSNNNHSLRTDAVVVLNSNNNHSLQTDAVVSNTNLTTHSQQHSENDVEDSMPRQRPGMRRLFPQASFTEEVDDENDEEVPRKKKDDPRPQRIITAPRAAALLTFGYTDLEVTSIRCDANFDSLDLDLPEPAWENKTTSNVLALHFTFGRYGEPVKPMPIIEEEPGEKLRGPYEAPQVGTVNFVLRSALSVLIFLWSLRLVF